MQIPKPTKPKKKQTYDIKRVKLQFVAKGIVMCEVPGCTEGYPLSFAHRHKRRWYLNKGDLINDFNQIILACIPCHTRLEQDKVLTKQVFDKLRG